MFSPRLGLGGVQRAVHVHVHRPNAVTFSLKRSRAAFTASFSQKKKKVTFTAGPDFLPLFSSGLTVYIHCNFPAWDEESQSFYLSIYLSKRFEPRRDCWSSLPVTSFGGSADCLFPCGMSGTAVYSMCHSEVEDHTHTRSKDTFF